MWTHILCQPQSKGAQIGGDDFVGADVSENSYDQLANWASTHDQHFLIQAQILANMGDIGA